MDWAAIGAWVIELVKVLIAPVAALAGALGGVVLTNRRASQAAREQQAATQRDAVRGLARDVTETGYGWVSAMFTYLSKEVLSFADPSVRVQNLSASDYELARTKHLSAIGAFILTVSDNEPAEAARQLQVKMENISESIGSALSTAVYGSRDDALKAIQPIMVFHNEYRKLVESFQSTLAPFTAAPLARATSPVAKTK